MKERKYVKKHKNTKKHENVQIRSHTCAVCIIATLTAYLLTTTISCRLQQVYKKRSLLNSIPQSGKFSHFMKTS